MSDPYLSFPQSARNHSFADISQSKDGLIERGKWKPVAPSMRARGMDSYCDVGDAQSITSQSYASKFPTLTQHDSNSHFTTGLAKTPATQSQCPEGYWEGTSNHSSVAPEFWSGATSGATLPPGLRRAEWTQGGYNFDNASPMPLGIDNNFVPLDDSISGLGVSCSSRRKYMGRLAESGYPPDLPRSAMSLPYNGLSAGRREYGIPERHRITDAALARHNSQLVSGLVEQQGTRILNDGCQDLHGSHISREFVDKRRPQQTASSNEFTRHIRETPKQKSCWQCRFKHERCTGGTPCDSCQSIFEGKGPYRFTPGCFRNQLEDFTSPFFPATLRQQLSCNWPYYYENEFRNGLPATFIIQLSVGFGEPIDALARVFDDQGDLIARSQRIAISKEKSSVVSEDVLPILPAGNLKDLVKDIRSWIDRGVRRPDFFFSWVNTTGMNKIHGDAGCGILRAIYHYLTECGTHLSPSAMSETSAKRAEPRTDPNITLLDALKTAILTTILSTGIKITSTGLKILQEVFQMKPAELSRKWMIPPLMNKAFKCAVFQTSVIYTKRSLIGLDRLLNQKDIPEGHVGSIVTLLASAMNSTQLSLVDVCRITKGTEEPVMYEQVKPEILELEDIFSKLCCLFHRKYKIETIKSERRYRRLDKKTKDLVDRLSNAIPALRTSTRHIRDLKFENMEYIHDFPPGHSVDKIATYFNTDRLFCALWAPMLTGNTRKRKWQREGDLGIQTN
ncbi:conserved hypothetical protein [Histoplasma capsulatum var. duboisii H88]|uniref:Zn(2)-C6 fungal-type domain-containing protein n=2 Tax=Ajellomyces capsulatus TaxID=5037 RepID=F0U6E2_AJEC8|nr:conserved hypothetical protein [Histoplasma capsulatum H143]EGC41478.1 conserved hypothetical protein [Histoplasma capsulatum var. duboisii H88]QSS52098.1 hypothetical protein I7I53_07606 [Histoplasma capsulatum var. duboisii H88]